MITGTHLDLYVDVSRLEEDALEIVRQVKKDWSDKKILVKHFTDGITNRLIGCFLPGDKDNKVLVRVYGEKTELFIDRLAEKRNMKLMTESGLAPPLFASFNNGLCYGFTPGQPVNYDQVSHPGISKLIADKMARMHSLVKPRRTPSFCSVSQCPPNCSSSPTSTPHVIKPCLFRYLYKYLELLSDCDDFHSKGRRHSVDLLFYSKDQAVPNYEELKHEVSFLETLLSNLDSPTVFCHNDLLLKNIIYHETSGITFIDFEYADFNFQAFDIANHFCEFAGVERYDPLQYPDEDFQREWIKHYISSWKRLNPPSPCDDTSDTVVTTNGKGSDVSVFVSQHDLEITEEEVEDLLSQVKKFAMAAHLLWGIWALIQSRHSKINFDFLSYARDRLKEYFVAKGKLLANARHPSNGHSKM